MGIRFCLIFQSQCSEVNVSHLLVYEKKKKHPTKHLNIPLGKASCWVAKMLTLAARVLL